MRLLANFLIELLSLHGDKKSIDLKDFADAYGTFQYPGKRSIARGGPFGQDFLKIANKEVLAAVATIGREVDESELQDASRKSKKSDSSGRQRRATNRTGTTHRRSAARTARRSRDRKT
jgi:hypothetical protein